MSEELGNVRVRMFISSIIIKYSRNFEVRDTGSGVVRIKKLQLNRGQMMTLPIWDLVVTGDDYNEEYFRGS